VRKRNVSGTFCGCRPRTVIPRCGPQAPYVWADQRPAASRFGEPMMHHELQVGSVWKAAEDETMPPARAAGAAVRQWAGGLPSFGPADQAWLRARVGSGGVDEGSFPSLGH
jgi:hypothetical protein